jgi:hypothetical protein
MQLLQQQHVKKEGIQHMPKTYENKVKHLPQVKTGEDMTHLLNKSVSSVGKKRLAIIEVDPHDQKELALGVFSNKNPPRGFMIEYTPEVESSSVVSKVVAISGANPFIYKLELFFANFSDKLITAEVWEL